jgi:hypothetical protein
MRTTLRYSTALVALAVIALAAAQEPLRRAPTLQERVTALEANVASIETRFGIQSARPSNLGTGESGLALAGRVDALERTLEQLARDVQRVQNLADNAARDAAQAQREAMAAQQAARDAAMRAR